MIIFENITVFREGKALIHDISFSCASGSVQLLLGKNGAGKSSFALSLMGHPAYTVSGHAYLNGVDLFALPPHERSKQGLFLSFQHSQEIPGVRADTFLYEMCRSHGYLFSSLSDFYAYLRPLLHQMNLDESLLSRELNHGFSGGEKKRFELLQLLLLKPKVALLDEPDSGLDRDAVILLGNAMQQIKKQCPDMIMIIITHYQTVLSFITPDVVHVMEKGRISHSGDAGLAHIVFKDGFELAER